MLIAVFGTPSPLTYWLVNVARQMAEVVYGGHLYIAAVTLEDMRAAWKDRDGRAVVFHSDIPQTEVVSLFLQSGPPILVCADAPADIVAYVAAARSFGFLDSLRFTSQSLAILAKLRHSPNAIYLNQTLYKDYVTDVIERVARHVGLTFAGQAFEDICSRVIGDLDRGDAKVIDLILRDFPLARQPGDYASKYSAEEQSIITDTIHTYGSLMEMRQPTTILCRPEIVPDRDNPGILLDGPRQMLGPARVMFGGHMIHLPVGSWKATVVLEVSENFSGNRLLSQVYSGSDLLEQVSAPFPVSGVFQYAMEFVVQDSFFPVQVLVCIAEGAIEGKLLLRSIAFDRIAAEA